MALTTSNHALAPAAGRVVTPLHVAVHPRAPVHHIVPHHGPVATDVKLVVHSAVLPPFESLAVMPNEDIQAIRMRLCNRGWFRCSHPSCLVFGDRELADAVKASDLIAASGRAHPSYLHVFVKMSDVESVHIRTMMRELSLSNPTSVEPQLTSSVTSTGRPLLALPAIPEPLTAATATDHGRNCSSSSASMCSDDLEAVAPAVVPAQASPAPPTNGVAGSTSGTSDGHQGHPVMHLMITKAAKLSWRNLHDDKFELDISSSSNSSNLPESAVPRIEAVGSVGLESVSSSQPLAAYGIKKGGMLELVPCEPEVDCDALPDGSPSLTSPAHQLHRHWQAAREGLAEGIAPQLVAAGTGGSYFLQDAAGSTVAVFKPCDEEPNAVNNPKGRTPGGSGSGSRTVGSMAFDISGGSSSSEGLRRGTRPGEGAVREVAAYVLDHGSFAGVPPTALVSAYISSDEGHGVTKVGSLQQFVPSESDAEERGYSSFSVDSVHRLAVLDIRLANADRNGGNILCQRGEDDSWRLIPIDHGYCLPSSFEDLSWEWQYWPQAEQAFSQPTLDYIAALDADRDLETLAVHGIVLSHDAVRVFKVCTMLLKKAAAAGLSAAQVAAIACREGMTKSALEKLHSNALQLAKASSGSSQNMDVYLQHMEDLISELVDEHLLDNVSA